nr:hypothetical protein [Tanacetum cinerariifolium]
MTRSSTKELFTPFKEPKQEFRSSKKLLKTLSLDESRSLEFNLFSDLEEYSEEEVGETMAKTMEQYMSKTRADYGLGTARPKIDDKDSFELKGQFLKELRDNTFSGSNHEDANEHIEKVLEILDLFHILNITQDQVMLRAFHMSLTRAASHWLRNKPSARTEGNLYQAWERFKELLKKCPQHYLTEIHEPSKKWLNTLKNGTMEHLGQEDVNNVKGPTTPKISHSKKKVKPSKKLTTLNLVQTGGYRAASQGFYQRKNANLSYQNRRKISKVLQERGFGSLASSTEANPRDHVKLMSTTAEADSNSIRHIGSPQSAISTPQNRRFMFESRQTTIPFLSRLNDYHCGEKKGSTVKYPKGLAENVLVELRRDQVDDLMHTIKEGEVINEPMIDIIKTRNNESFDEYPSFCDFDRKIHIDCAYNLRFSCMIGFEHKKIWMATEIKTLEILFLENQTAKLHGLTAKKSTKLVKYRSSRILCAVIVMMEYIRIYNIHPCS